MVALAGELTSREERNAVEMKARSRLALTRLHTKSRASIGADALAAASMRSGSPLTLRREDPTGWLGAMTAALAAGAYQRMVEEAARALAPDLAAPLEALVRFELAWATSSWVTWTGRG